FFRAFVRPYTVIIVISAIVGLAIYLAIKFATPELTRDVIIFLLGSGSIIVGVLFGERAAKKPPVAPPKE
ncbi:unnamed protein product, partial [marine sediment metagenome]